MDAKAQPSAYEYVWCVVINGHIDSKWRAEQDADTWAARLASQARSWGGQASIVNVSRLPETFSILTLDKTDE